MKLGKGHLEDSSEGYLAVVNPTLPWCRSISTTSSLRNVELGKNLLIAFRTVLLQEQVDMVAGDFNGAARRRQSGKEHRPSSTVEEAFANTCLPIPSAPQR